MDTHTSLIGLKTKTLADMQELRKELKHECPRADKAIQSAFVAFQKGDPWDTFLQLGEALGAIDVYLAVAKTDERTAQVEVFTHLKTWTLTVVSSARAVASQEWAKAS